jgi:hypothetical protein
MKLVILILCAWFLTSCGYDNDSEPAPAPAASDSAWDAIKPVVVANCGKCHNGVKHPLDFSKKAAFINSKSKVRIAAGTMPPAGHTLSSTDKDLLLAYLK